MRTFLGVLCTLLAATLVSAVSSAGNRLLVIMDDVAQKGDYSQFFGDLTSRGYDITYDTPRTEDLALFRLGERLYDHLVFLPTKVKALGPSLTPNILVDFIKADGNILLTMSSELSTPTSLVALLAELDVALPAERTGTIVDHFSYDTVSASDKHDVLVLDAPINVRPGMKPYFELGLNDVLAVPHAVGHALGHGPLLTPILRAPATAYSYNPKEQSDALDSDDLFVAGKQLAVVSAVQTRNSARVAVVGSAEMLLDKTFADKVARVGGGGDKAVPVNREFAKMVSGWAFKEIGVLRVNEVQHHLVGDKEMNPEIYRISNNVSYSISVSEYRWGKWVPFTLPTDDALQLEFSMLSPFHRLDLTPRLITADAAVYGATFVLPDQHGIFNFKVNYKRSFLTYLDEKDTVSVRHMAHDEWPRSYAISGAWPWATGIGATAAGFLGFCAVWMYSKPTEKVARR